MSGLHSIFVCYPHFLQVLEYGQSDYVRQFGMNVETTAGFLPVSARILNPPTLKYGPGSKQPTIVSTYAQYYLSL
jgi:hypothetical protein